MTRRVDALRLDTARIHPTERETQTVETPGSDRVRRQQFDKAQLQADRVQDSGTLEQSTIGSLPEPTLWHRPQSPDEVLAEFVAPGIPDPALLRRSVPILQHCITDLVPNLDGGEQLQELAKTLMEEEIERHHTLLERMQGGFEPD